MDRESISLHSVTKYVLVDKYNILCNSKCMCGWVGVSVRVQPNGGSIDFLFALFSLGEKKMCQSSSVRKRRNIAFSEQQESTHLREGEDIKIIKALLLEP